MRILGFGTYDVGRHPRTAVILEGFAAHDDTVVEFNEPLGFTTDERVRMISRPWLAYRFVLRLMSRWARLTRRSVGSRRDGGFDLVFVGYLGHFDVVLARLLFPRTRIALDLLIFGADTAHDRGVSGRLRLRVLGLLDRLAIACADLVVLDTDEHLELLPKRALSKAVVVSVGAGSAWFAAGDVPSSLEPGMLKVVFFGLFTPLQGTPAVGEALALLADRPDIKVTMIGTGQDYGQTKAIAADNPSISWHDWVDPAALPGVVAAHDICLGIFGTTPKALRVVPNKVYEGAAAGCAIVTSDTPPQRRTLGDAAWLVPPGDPRALAETLRMLADDRDLTSEYRTRARLVAKERFKPAAIVVPLRDRLNSLTTRG